MPSSTRPPTTATHQPLPYERLSVAQFERLCRKLIERESYQRVAPMSGPDGEEGRYIVAWEYGYRFTVVCRRVRRFGPKSAEAEIERIGRSPVLANPDRLVFIVTCDVSPKTRKAAQAARGAPCRFWAGSELDRKILQHRELVEEFFVKYLSGEDLRTVYEARLGGNGAIGQGTGAAAAGAGGLAIGTVQGDVYLQAPAVGPEPAPKEPELDEESYQPSRKSRTRKRPPRRELRELLVEFFDLDFLRLFARDYYEVLFDEVQWNQSLRPAADGFVSALQARGLVDEGLFDRLLESRPGQSERIETVRKACRPFMPEPPEIRREPAPEESRREKGHRPRYLDGESEKLSGRLKALFRRRKDLTIAGEDTRLVEGEILDVRRLLRKGPQHRPGEFLLDERYELLESLGRGGFATVWKAWESGAERLVALKVLHGHLSEDRSRRQRFLRGARKMAELAHPHIVRVYEVELEDDGWHFFSMEYVRGGNLEQAVLAERLELEERLKILLDAGAALEHAHRSGVVHRDVKPANILLDAEGRAKLADFDLVRAEDTTGLTQTRAMMGTVQFAAPEALESAKEAGASADVYGLGSTAVFAVRGKPLPRWYYRMPEKAIASLDCGEPLKEVLVRATAFEPGARQASVEALCREIEEVASRATQSVASASVEKAREPAGETGRSETGAPRRRRVRRAEVRAAAASEESREEIFRWIDTPLDGRVALWREIPAGGFLMGSLPDEEGRDDDEGPQHEVRITSPFRIGVVPVTNAQFLAFDRSFEPYSWQGVSQEELAYHPAVNVSWKRAMEFCAWLAEVFRWARGARLPTEEEWEYTCRAGTETRYWSGDTESDLDRVGWYAGNSSGRTHRVSEKPANSWGLYDVHGNVWEWTLSEWIKDYSGREGGLAVDPSTPADVAGRSGAIRVFRGGGCRDVAQWARSAYRERVDPGVEIRGRGFRVLLPGAPSDL